ncbi:MAG: DNA internalization-related competence protein ComEC/Rec2 [Oscillospiraceae bacterium]|nr:DNA internalization-related competence protein ComEC/Rec2 [Oscillospiraceae bacterium]
MSFLNNGRNRSIILILAASVIVFAVHFALRYNYVVKPALALAGEQLDVDFTATDYPRESRYGYLVPVRAFGVDVALYMSDSLDVNPGDIVSSYVKLSISNSRNYTLNAAQPKNIVVQKSNTSIRYFPAIVRHYLLERVYELFGAESAPFTAALMLGDTSGFSTIFRSALSVTGLSHTFSLSGLHISFLVGICSLLFGGMRRAAPFTIPFIIIFTAVVGFPPSAVRACVMNILALAALLIKRDYDSRVALSLGLGIILAVNPFAVQEVGLWLSFLATFGLISFAGRLSAAVSRKLPRKLGLLRGAVRSLSTTMAALAFTTPLVAYVFGVISIIAPLMNLLLLPIISVLFIGSILSVGLSFIFMPLGKIAALCIGWLFELFESVIITTAKFPFAAIYTNNTLTVVLLVFIYAVLLLCYIGWRRGIRNFTLPICAVFCSFCVVIFGNAVYYDKSDSMRVTAVDVGQGQGLMLSTGGRAVIVDCGGSYADYVMPSAVLSQSAGGIDAVILSHFHSDHTNGVEALLGRVKVDYLIFYDDLADDMAEARAALEKAAARSGTEVLALTSDSVVQMGDCRLDLIMPRNAEDINERCVSVLADYNGFTMLTTGDMDGFGERNLLRSADIPTLDVLIPGHHGSKFATCETLLLYTRPKAAIISAGVNNSYGHPASETLERLYNAGVTVYGTNVHETITITVGGKNNDRTKETH